MKCVFYVACRNCRWDPTTIRKEMVEYCWRVDVAKRISNKVNYPFFKQKNYNSFVDGFELKINVFLRHITYLSHTCRNENVVDNGNLKAI